MDERNWCIAPEKIRTERVTADQVVANTPSLIFSLDLSPDGASAGRVIIYNGSSDKGEYKLDLRAAANQTVQLNYWPPLLMTRGIFVDVVTSTKSLVVRYVDWRE